MTGIIDQQHPEQTSLIIPALVFGSMLAHCRSDYPNEACGILAGKDMIVSELFMVTNTEKSPVSYLMDPKEQIKVMRELRDRTLQMLAIYHSHPNSEAYPSVNDLDMAYYEDAVHVIVSLAKSGSDVRSFSIKNGEVREVGIVVVSESQL